MTSSSNLPATRIALDIYLSAAKDFVELSNKYTDGWSINQNLNKTLHTYLKKDVFISHQDDNGKENLFRAEYVIFYNLSYGVPSFSFNVWDCTGKLLTLEEVRRISLMNISTKDFYSVVTQQEHPILHRPYFIIHPCHTAELLSVFNTSSKNIIVTFLSLITPLIELKLPLEYGMLS